jgi:hypothetical protein
MTNDYRLTHLGPGMRVEMPALSGQRHRSLYRDDEDSSLTSLTLLRAGAALGMTPGSE